MKRWVCAAVGFAGSAVTWFSVAGLSAEERVDYSREVRPILAENCFACHGFDEAARQAELRLDTFEGSTADRSGVRAIVPGDPDGSELVSRILTDDSDLLMPPADSGKQLTPDQKALLRRWIEQGARYDAHWAFIAPQRTPVPEVSGADHPIDRFILSRLAREGLSPSPAASLETLIRRVSLDLIGLPPTPTEIDAFLAASETDPEAAYRELIERLLASPHYGERWGRWWLDQARYADSNGYSIDGPRQIWKYRDWVIDALNHDMPFDQFTIEQFAGDLLPEATQDQKIATGFHRNTQINQEGGIDKEQFRIDSIFDRVATTGTVWLGLSIGCAQCHDHKFDPITQREYYRLFAFLNNQDEPTMNVYADHLDVPRLTAELEQTQQQLAAVIKERSSELARWEEQLSDDMKGALPGAVRKSLETSSEKRSFADNLTLLMAAGEVSDGVRELHDRHADLGRQLATDVTTFVMQERTTPRRTTVFIKGDFTRPSDEVSPGTPAVLHDFTPPADAPQRLDLARWL
ncbi:MAG: DUF1549 domain-containing protein, partial [Planctomycetaceae bacterium]|nr:DUF1549 domain-containing protein [Planctomycetaceae bacterium]